jgi:DeoR/GlpR family transcriptional regulator of sugar metabolism
MARDMNVLRQNIQKLVKLKGGKSRIGAADNFFDREVLKKEKKHLEAERASKGIKSNSCL